MQVTNGSWSFKSQTDIPFAAASKTADQLTISEIQALQQWSLQKFEKAFSLEQAKAFYTHIQSLSNQNYYSDLNLETAGGHPNGKLDFYTVHWYDKQGPLFPSPFVYNYDFWQLDKPLAVTEFGFVLTTPAYPSMLYNDLFEKGYAGAMLWQWYDWHCTYQNPGGDYCDNPNDETKDNWPLARVNMEYVWNRHKDDVELPDITPPTVQSSNYGGSPSTTISVTFTEDMEQSTFNAVNIAVVGSSSGNHPSSFNYTSSDNTININPNTDFSFGETVTVALAIGITDLAGNGLDGDGDGITGPNYEISFTINAAPDPDPTSLNVTATLSPSSVPPFFNVNVNGTATYNTGGNVPVGIVEIDTGENIYTASLNNGVFNRSISAPSSSGNISITVQDGQFELTQTINRFITIQGSGGTPGYDLDTYVVYDYVNDGSSWSIKDAFRTTDEFVELFAYFNNLNINHDLDLMWRFYKPDGNQYGHDLIKNNAIDEDWVSGWSSWGFLINEQSMALNPGRYKVKFYVDGDRKATHEYVVAWDFTEHRLARDVQTSDPFMPIGETDVFYQDNARVYTWANFDLVAQGTELKSIFYEPSGAVYSEVNSSDWPTYVLPDPGGSHTWQSYYRVWASIGIQDNDAANKTGDWRAEFFVKNPTSGAWQKYYDEYFKILERPDVAPSVSVTMNPTVPIESQDVTLNVNVTDNTYLKRVVLYWDDGSLQSKEWNDLYAGSLVQTHPIGSFAAGQQIEYWVKAWDTSGNEQDTLQTITIAPETVSPPSQPTSDETLDVAQTGTFTTGGASTSLGNPVEYQFDWGDGTLSAWGAETQQYVWTSTGEYFVRARARSQANSSRVSGWSNALLVTITPPDPVMRYVATNGSDAGNNDCTNAANRCATLGHAVNKANAGDTIDIAAGSYPLVMSLLIDKALTIQGQGAIIGQ